MLREKAYPGLGLLITVAISAFLWSIMVFGVWAAYHWLVS